MKMRIQLCLVLNLLRVWIVKRRYSPRMINKISALYARLYMEE